MSYIVTNGGNLFLHELLPLNNTLWKTDSNKALRFKTKKEAKEIIKDINDKDTLIKARLMKIED